MYLQGSRSAQRGQLFTTGPGTYKIPSCKDAPLDFRVALLGRAPNPKAIFSSKVTTACFLFLCFLLRYFKRGRWGTERRGNNG